jgi:hypothetical protein
MEVALAPLASDYAPLSPSALVTSHFHTASTGVGCFVHGDLLMPTDDG